MKIAGAVVTAVLLTLLLGCGASARDAVELARSRWEHATGLTQPVPKIVEVHGLFKCRSIENRVRPVKQWASGCWDGATRTLTLDVDSPILDWVALHEWGHVLGARDGSPGALMCHSFDCSWPFITSRDVWNVCDGPNGPCRVENPEQWLRLHLDQNASTQSY